MANYKGRGAQAVRPGLTIKGVLMGNIPLFDGRTVTEASITDVHNAYKELTRRVNIIRPKERKLRGMTYPSFYTIFRLARYLNLVEFIRDEPMLYPPPHGNLLSIRKNHGFKAEISARRIYRLTEKGRIVTRPWENLHRAWEQHQKKEPF